jgi:hypothetical protein
MTIINIYLVATMVAILAFGSAIPVGASLFAKGRKAAPIGSPGQP